MKMLVALFSVVAVFLTGCATESTSSPAPRVTETVTAYPEVEDTVDEYEDYNLGVDVDEIFVEIVWDGVGPSNYYYKEFTDQELVDWAKSFCERMDGGDTIYDLNDDAIAEFGDNPDGLDLYSSITGAGIAAYCPEHAPADWN